MSGLDHAFVKVLDAVHGGISSQSTGEQLMAALCLNRADWFQEMNYTIAEALERVGDEWGHGPRGCAESPKRARTRGRGGGGCQRSRCGRTISGTWGDRRRSRAGRCAARADFLRCNVGALRLGGAWLPGHGDGFRPSHRERPLRVEMRLSAHDGDRVGEHLRRIHRDAWEREGRSPLDVQPGEVRPRWIG